MQFSILLVMVILLFWTVSAADSQVKNTRMATLRFSKPRPRFFPFPTRMRKNRRGHYYDMILENESFMKHIYVAKDGSGHARTVQAAIDMVPNGNTQPVKIIISAGVYREKVVVPSNKAYITLIGQGRKATFITWHDRASDKDVNGQFIGTLDSASFAVESDYFSAQHITFENTAPYISKGGSQGSQAVALRISGDKATFIGCGMLSSQDTLFDHMGRHYFLNCYIQGNVDFVFGSGRSLYQGCHLHVNGDGYGAVAASQRNSPYENSGFSFVDCQITGEGSSSSSSGMTYLGRAWGRYATIVFSNCYFDNVVMPKGWSDWEDPSRRSTVFFGEYNCKGPGSMSNHRVKWAKILNFQEALPYMGTDFIDGHNWLNIS